MIRVTRTVLTAALACCLAAPARADFLVPMDDRQTDHLKAYGLAYWCLQQGERLEWLLNYRGGAFLLPETENTVRQAALRGVKMEAMSGGDIARVHAEMELNNMDVVHLETAPRMAVYAPPTFQPWDDAVALALTYAEIPYTRIYDDDVLQGALKDYDWLHMHHEDFTGQFGKFYPNYAATEWYQKNQADEEARAARFGYARVWQLKHAVAGTIKKYVAGGGFLFAMCTATDTYDIAMADGDVDMCDRIYDGDGYDPHAQAKLDFSQTLAFQNFQLELNPLTNEFSNIDTSGEAALRGEPNDFFTLFDFSAKEDPVPTMLTQDHTGTVHGFLGQTTGFRKSTLKPGITILAETQGTDEAKYIHGNFGKGTFTFYGGHDPEDYQHMVGDPPTELALHKHSPGYRLILNNVLFPAAEKKERKT